jgi:hypothetical protein
VKGNGGLTSACKPTAFGAGMRARGAQISWFAGTEVWHITAAAETQTVRRLRLGAQRNAVWHLCDMIGL